MLAWVILADQVDSRRHNDEVPHLLTALTSPGLLVSPTGYTVGTPQWVLPPERTSGSTSNFTPWTSQAEPSKAQFSLGILTVGQQQGKSVRQPPHARPEAAT